MSVPYSSSISEMRDDTESCTISITSPLSYLKHFVHTSDKCRVIHGKAIDTDDSSLEIIPNDDYYNYSKPTENRDVIGNPLEIDLDHNFGLAKNEIDVVPNNWSKMEEFAAISVNSARSSLQACKDMFTDENVDEPSSVFCICDSNDPEKIVVIGSKISESDNEEIVIMYKGYFPKDHKLLNPNHLIELHKDYAGCEEVRCSMKESYKIYGIPNLHNADRLLSFKANGSILMDVSWRNCILPTPSCVSSAEMHVKTILGHQESHLHAFWLELALLQRYFSSLENNDFDNLKMNDYEAIFDQGIVDQFDEMLNSLHVIRKPVLKDQVSKELDLGDLRNPNFIDKLWALITKSANLKVACNALQFLFSELSFNGPMIAIPADFESNVADLLRGILGGTIAVPSLTPQKTLEYIIELGIHKLKSDYISILNTWDCRINSNISDNFRAEKNSEEIVSNRRARMTRFNDNDGGLRKTIHRLTVHRNLTQTDTKRISQQLQTLVRLHIVCDAVYLVFKNSKLTNFSNIFQDICDNALKNTSCASLKEGTLHNVTILPQKIDKDYLEKQVQLSWQLTVESPCGSIVSNYHHSLMPIFPPCIISNTENPIASDSGEMYYTTHSISSKDKFC